MGKQIVLHTTTGLKYAIGKHVFPDPKNKHFIKYTEKGTSIYDFLKNCGVAPGVYPNPGRKVFNLVEGGTLQVTVTGYNNHPDVIVGSIIIRRNGKEINITSTPPGQIERGHWDSAIVSIYDGDVSDYNVIVSNYRNRLDGSFSGYIEPNTVYSAYEEHRNVPESVNQYIDFYNDSAWYGMFSGIRETVTFPGDVSVSGGGTGDLDGSSDTIAFPDIPSLSATDAGFISLYVPTKSQMHDLSSYMWSDSFNLDQFKKILADPMDIIIGLNIIPTIVKAGTTENIKIGLIDTGIAMNKAAEQYITVDCGSLTVNEYWGSALDYSPYTKISIFLPYIGTRELKTDDVMGKTISVKYNIDILSGACTAMIKCGNSILYEFSGSCGSPIPLTSVNWTNTVTACIQLAAAGIGVAAGAAGAAAGAAGSAGGLTAVQGANLVSSTAGSVMSAKPNIQRSGAVSGSAGMLGLQIPYLIVERPRQSLAEDYNKYVGYPSNITANLGELSGYTEVESIHLDGFNASDAEVNEIYKLLREGVIL